MDYFVFNTVCVMVTIAIQSNPTAWFVGWLKITHTWIESICLQRHDTDVYMHLLYTPDCRQSLLLNSPCQLANRPTMWRSPGISTTIYSKKDIYWLVNKRQSIAIVYLYLVIECKLQNEVFWFTKKMNPTLDKWCRFSVANQVVVTTNCFICMTDINYNIAPDLRIIVNVVLR